jgi:predicted phosphodiesterase
MMRLAFITDIHADVKTLVEALRQIDKMGCDLTLCGGDLVDVGWYPDATIKLIRDRKIACIRGNHDRWLIERLGAPATGRKDAEEWLPGAEDEHFLAVLPTSWSATLVGTRVAVHHASPRSDMEGIYPDLATGSDVRRWLDQARADVMLVGHTHIPFTLSIPGRGIIANPGALLRDIGDNGALIYNPATGAFDRGIVPAGGTFGILELPSLRFTVHRASDGTEVEIVRNTLF